MRIVQRAPIFLTPPAPQCHASTVAEVRGGELLSAWFGGAREGAADVGIWASRWSASTGAWSRPSLVVSEPGVPCWNPVLFRDRAGTLWLFYRVGPNIGSWTGCYRQSDDEGQSWGPIHRLPAGLLGPIKNKPIQMYNGEILCPSSVESYGTWTAWVEVIGQDAAWNRYGPITLQDESANPADQTTGLIQPTLWESAPGSIHALLRSTENIGRICHAVSGDLGRAWSAA
ncbi:MAG: exo-alpha-sialidase, partial [Chloroflexi bacterium]|nr:exo-alpha-sialidase [Chloroflexota bacterium]